MPYTLKIEQVAVKDPQTGEYTGVDVLAEQTKEGLIAELQAEGARQQALIVADVDSAEENALKSEGFAIGEQDGTAVGSTSPYYHNNAEYFRDQATSSAMAASGSATAAAGSATAAAASAAYAQAFTGAPRVAATAAAMTDTDLIYVYTGSESGYTAGNWYYYNGSAWASGGVYNSGAVNVDATLAIEGAAADAAACGAIKSALNGITESTVNVWANKRSYSGTGYNNTGIYYISSPEPFPAGTYTLSAKIVSNDTSSMKRLVGVYDVTGNDYQNANKVIATTVDRDVRFSITFTAANPFNKFKFCASNNDSNSAGDTLTVSDIQLQTGSSATPYVEPETWAIDKVAREEIADLGTDVRDSHVVIYSGFDAGVIDTSGDSITIPQSSEAGNLWPLNEYYSGTGYNNTGVYYLVMPSSLPAGSYVLSYDISSTDTDNDKCLIGVYDTDAGSYTNAHRLAYYASPRGNNQKFSFTTSAAFQRFTINAAVNSSTSAGDTVTFKNITLINTETHKVIPCKAGDEFIVESLGGGASKLQYVFCDSSYNILQKSDVIDTSGDTVNVPFDPFKIATAPTDSAYLVVNHREVEKMTYSPKVYKLSGNTLCDYMARYQLGMLPFGATEDWKNKVIAVYQSMVAIIDDGVIKLSRDCGNTWNSGVDVSAVGTVVNAYLYSNGNVGFFTNTNAYYIEDWETYSEASCYEADGTTAYVPASSENFNTPWSHTERKFSGCVDWFVFGNYHTEPTTRSLIWCSTDFGHTYKIIWEFGSRSTTTPEGSWQVRHVHDVLYYKNEDVYIITTGDTNASECMVFSMRYASGTWTVTKLVDSAREYKWACMGIWDNEIYYTQDNTLGSVWKCKYADINDLSKHECIFEGSYNDSTGLVIGNKGDILVTTAASRNTASQTIPSPYGFYEAVRQAFYSSDRKNFNEVYLPNLWLYGATSMDGTKPVLSDGSVFLKTNGRRSVCASEVVKAAGFAQAFSPKL